MSILNAEATRKLQDLNREHTRAYNALKSGLIEELAEMVDDTHAVKINDRYNTFYNHCINEAEPIHYLTTDGEQLFLMSGDDECFFADDDYGEIHWGDLIWLLGEEATELVEIEWTTMR